MQKNRKNGYYRIQKNSYETEKVKVMGEIEDELAEMVADLSSKFLSEKLDDKKIKN